MQTRKINIGNRVILKQRKRNKLTPILSQYLYVVTNIKGSMITTFNKATAHTLTRNISFFKVIQVTAKAPRPKITIEGEEGEHRLS